MEAKRYIKSESDNPFDSWNEEMFHQIKPNNWYEKNIEVIEAGNSFIEIKEGTYGSSYFNIFTAKVKDINNDPDDMDNIDANWDDSISIEEENIRSFVYPILIKYYNSNLPENKKRTQEGPEFAWWLTYNYFTFDSIKEMIIANLNGIGADFEYNFKTISNKKETYDYHVFHNNINTISNIKNNGVCVLDGEIIYQVSSFVPKNIIGCIANQNNRIINLTDNKCEIRPNLYIDCNDVEASHSALICKFSDEEMFYIQSRGIDYKNALKLLISGFLLSDIENKKIIKEVNKNIEKYWR